MAEHYAGEARAGVAVTQETLFPLASVTKPVTAATFMTLVDEGAVSLDEPVGRHLPDFRAGPAAGAEGVDPTLERLRPTIGARQLLCHVSGLPEDLGPRETLYRDGATIEQVIDQMCRLPLQSAPGDQLRYSNAGYGVIARLAAHISEQSFWQIAQDRVLEPLGIQDIVADPAGPHYTGSHISPTRVIPERTSKLTTARIGVVWHCRGVDSSARLVMLSALRPRFFRPERGWSRKLLRR